MNDLRIAKLQEDACFALLRDADIGRLVVCSEESGVDVFPINFVVDRGTLLFRTDEGTKTRLIRAGASTAVEIDDHDDVEGVAWSVVAKGRCHVIERFDEMVEALDVPIQPWLPDGKHLILRLEPDEVSGRQFRRGAAAGPKNAKEAT